MLSIAHAPNKASGPSTTRPVSRSRCLLRQITGPAKAGVESVKTNAAEAALVDLSIGAGGGTRTLKLLRARAPKARAVANFATPAVLRDRTVLVITGSVGGLDQLGFIKAPRRIRWPESVTGPHRIPRGTF